jgi:hypothetical protein
MRPLPLILAALLGLLCWLAIGAVVWFAWRVVLGW